MSWFRPLAGLQPLFYFTLRKTILPRLPLVVPECYTHNNSKIFLTNVTIIVSTKGIGILLRLHKKQRRNASEIQMRRISGLVVVNFT